MKKVIFFVVNLLAILVKFGLIFPLIAMGAIDLLGTLFVPTFFEKFAYDVIAPYVMIWEISATFFVVWGTFKTTPVHAFFAIASFLATLVPLGLVALIPSNEKMSSTTMLLFLFSIILGFLGSCFLYYFSKKSATFWLYAHSSILED